MKLHTRPILETYPLPKRPVLVVADEDIPNTYKPIALLPARLPFKKPPPGNVFIADFVARNPFFNVMGKKEMGNRPYVEIVTEGSWGTLTMRGPKLSTYELDIMIALNELLVEQKSISCIEYSESGLCKRMHRGAWGDNFKLIRDGIVLLSEPSFKLETDKMIYFGGRLINKGIYNKETARGFIYLDASFWRALLAQTTTWINKEIYYEKLWPIAKHFYQFSMSHREPEPMHVDTISKAIGLSLDQPLKQRKFSLKQAGRKLKQLGELERFGEVEGDRLSWLPSKHEERIASIMVEMKSWYIKMTGHEGKFSKKEESQFKNAAYKILTAHENRDVKRFGKTEVVNEDWPGEYTLKFFLHMLSVFIKHGFYNKRTRKIEPFNLTPGSFSGNGIWLLWKDWLSDKFEKIMKAKREHDKLQGIVEAVRKKFEDSRSQDEEYWIGSDKYEYEDEE